MSERTCENVCLSAMAIADGYPPVLPPDQVEAHLRECARCRHEVEQLKTLGGWLDASQRRRRDETIWGRIQPHLPAAAPARPGVPAWPAFLLLGVLLFGYKVVELVPDRDFGLLFKLLP